jgi:uncharacterized protein (DUF927 family)
MSMLEAALFYLGCGISIIPCQYKEKHPLLTWNSYRERFPTKEELKKWFPKKIERNLAAIMGKISGNMEALDIDEKHEENLSQEFLKRASEYGLDELIERIPRQRTPTGGFHLVYRCNTIAGSQKLALNEKKEVIIETRGEGGYIIISPSFEYKWENKELLHAIPTITEEERDSLLSLARSFNKLSSNYNPPIPEQQKAGPGTVFNEKGNWKDILESHGWTFVFKRKGIEYLRRPGKDRGISATINYDGKNLLHVFSTNAFPFENKNYNKFAAYTLLNFQGNFSNAAKDLFQKGYIPDKPSKLRLVNESEDFRQIKDFIKDAPEEDLYCPSNWKIQEGGIFREEISIDATGAKSIQSQRICFLPVYITKRIYDIDTNEEKVEISWYKDDLWHQQVISRLTLASSNSIISLSNLGIPINSNNAKMMIKFFEAFECLNLDQIPIKRATGIFGWHGSNLFMWGNQLIEKSHIWMEDPPLIFSGKDAGEEQVAKALYLHGTFEEWSTVLELIQNYPRVIFGLYASLAPPLIKILKAPNFVVNWSYITSAGKTSLLRLAASVWGNPDEKSAASLIKSWDTTRIGLERTATLLNDLPIFLDDTKQVPSSELLSSTIYKISAGIGRIRGSPKGTQVMGTWNSILLTNGEYPINSNSSDGGAFVRTIEMWGNPWEESNRYIAKLIDTIWTTISRNYGHLGPIFIQILMKLEPQWKELKNIYEKSITKFLAIETNSPAEFRMAAYFALLDVTAALADAHFKFPWSGEKVLEKLWKQVAKDTAYAADKAQEFLVQTLEWAHIHESEFYERARLDSKGNPIPPVNGWLGSWERDNKNNGFRWEFIGIFPNRLKAFITSLGGNYNATIKIWKERGWLLEDEIRHFRKQIRIGNERWDVLAIPRNKIEEIRG